MQILPKQSQSLQFCGRTLRNLIASQKTKLDLELHNIHTAEIDLRHAMDKQGINPKDSEHLSLFLENLENRELYE